MVRLGHAQPSFLCSRALVRSGQSCDACYNVVSAKPAVIIGGGRRRYLVGAVAATTAFFFSLRHPFALSIPSIPQGRTPRLAATAAALVRIFSIIAIAPLSKEAPPAIGLHRLRHSICTTLYHSREKSEKRGEGAKRSRPTAAHRSPQPRTARRPEIGGAPTPPAFPSCG